MMNAAMSDPTLIPSGDARPTGDRQSTAKPDLATKRPNRKSLDHTGKATADLVRAVGRRIGREADPEDLPLLEAIERALDQAWRAAIDGLRAQGRSDADIARGLGVTRQAVWIRWPHNTQQEET